MVMYRPLIPVLLLFLPALSSAVVRAQPADRLLELWLDAAKHHIPGTADAHAREVAGWSKEQLVTLLGKVADAYSLNEAIWRGAILHLDIALRVPTRAHGLLLRSYPKSGPPPPPMPYYVVDGTGTGLGISSTHLEFAREIIGKFEPPSAGREFARLWYVASAAELARRRDYAGLTAHLEHARRIVPDDAEILLASGCLHEAFASPNLQVAARERAHILVGGRGANLRRAERYFRQAVAANPRLAEARLRLGRVLGLRNRHPEAIVELERALGDAEDPRQSYYALLFLGRVEEELGRLERARRHVERAAKLFPGAQSPGIALSRLALEADDEQGARRALDEVLSASADPAGGWDPWWIYELGPGRYAGRKLLELYRSLNEEQS